MSTLYMTYGLPASGKSTWAKARTISRVNKDDLRAMLHGGKWSQSNERVILSVRNQIITSHLERNESIIVDDTNLDPKHERDLRGFAEKYHAAFEIVPFTHVSLEECIRRDGERANGVGVKVIREMYNRYLAPKRHARPKYDSALPDAIIVDVDGTVALMGDSRKPFDWDKVGLDQPNQPIINLIERVTQEEKFPACTVLFVSGRDNACREGTEKWFAQNIPFTYSHFFMRSHGDNRDDRIVKEEIYHREIEGKYNVLWVFDDRSKVVRMWRELGLTCLQVEEGDF